MTAKEETAFSTRAGSGSRMDDSSVSCRIDKWLVEGGHRLGEVYRRTLSDRRTLSRIVKWLVEDGHRLGEVYRRTLSNRRALRQRHGQTGNTAPIDESTSLNSITVITLGDSRSTSTMLPTKTTITLEALLTRSDWILTSNTLCRHVDKRRRKI